MKSIESMGAQLRKALYQGLADSKLKRTKAKLLLKDPKEIIEKAVEEYRFNFQSLSINHVLIDKDAYRSLILLAAKLHNENIRLKKGMKDE